MFKPVSSKVNFPELEEEILKYWKENKVFEKSVEQRPIGKKWNFLDGPPFITGMPHYGTLLSSLPKDVYPRFKTMQGYRVGRVWGWDCHGLPAENKVENKLKLKSKREIEEKVGVKKFIDECKLYVSEVSSEWEWYVDHIGRWVDFKNAYRTMDKEYMESVMWVFKQMYDKGYIYKGLRVSLYCPHCATPISNFEVAMDAENYKEISDPATTYKYELLTDEETADKNQFKTYILAWSTTPWTKIVTPALAVNPDLIYLKVKQNNEFYILAKSAISCLIGEFEIVDEFSGIGLIGRKFIPHYDYYPIEKGKKAFEVIGGDFVSADEGTGVVTVAAYGEEDLTAMKKDNIHIEIHLDEEGTIKNEVPLFGSMYYLKANKFVEEDLQKRNLIYKTTDYLHKVPLCWRCHTRLYYAPQEAWYVNVQNLKPLLRKTNEAINWFPKHFKHGRFLKSLENAPDWNISRSRYWGSPVPVWECDCGERFVPGSIAELEQASKQTINDLHKPEIDEVEITCRKCSKKVKRVSEVLDSWIEAGSASFAERHFPFKNADLQDFFPPDFIAEYTGQIRAWFYVLHVIGGALYDSPSFKNVVVEGVILGTDGRKMSKNFGNYPDPRELLEEYGGDALRMYLLGSVVMRGEDIIISEEQYRNKIKGPMLMLWNVYNFFVTYANMDGWEVKDGKRKIKKSNNVLDRWIISLTNNLNKEVTESLENFDTVKAVSLYELFIDDLSKWYIRRSRDRVGTIVKSEEDREAFYSTIYDVLITLMKLMAPVAPFMTDNIYRNLTNEESVHLSNWPVVNPDILVSPSYLVTDRQKLEGVDLALIEQMQTVRRIVEIGHAKRKELAIKVRQPLSEFKIQNIEIGLDDELVQLIKEELNVKNVNLIKGTGELIVEFDVNITDSLREEGEARDIVRNIQEERKKLGTSVDEAVNVIIPSWPKAFESYIRNQAHIKDLEIGDKLIVTRLSQ